MMLTAEQAQYFLQLPKKVEINGELKDRLSLTQKFPFLHRFNLISPNDDGYIFLYDIYQSKKNQFKLTLFLMEEDTKIGLLRIDYNGQHKNPEHITEKVPKILQPYVGKFFDYHEHHIHLYVEGYKTPLDWALPLTNHDFPIKNIDSPIHIIESFFNFNKIINLQTNFIIAPCLL